jgi:hypothetical protein
MCGDGDALSLIAITQLETRIIKALTAELLAYFRRAGSEGGRSSAENGEHVLSRVVENLSQLLKSWPLVSLIGDTLSKCVEAEQACENPPQSHGVTKAYAHTTPGAPAPYDAGKLEVCKRLLAALYSPIVYNTKFTQLYYGCASGSSQQRCTHL